MNFKKYLILVIAFMVLANIPYIGYLPYSEIRRCSSTGGIMVLNCGGEESGVYLNPVFWLPFIFINKLLHGNTSFKFFLSYTYGHPQYKNFFDFYFSGWVLFLAPISIIYSTLVVLLFSKLYKVFFNKKF